eukprot:COSAG01_NODE_66_length_29241_cov_17.772768_24_plen_215_part_00
MVAAPACHGHSRVAGSANKRLLRVVLVVAVHALCQGRAGACGFESFSRLKSILATCCESTNATDCSAGFPKTCSLACGKLLIPFYNDCRHMMSAMPPQNFKFHMKDMSPFVKGCEHTQELFQYSRATCAASAKAREQRALDVQASCCSQKAYSTSCRQDTVPWTCATGCLSRHTLVASTRSYDLPPDRSLMPRCFLSRARRRCRVRHHICAVLR